MTKRILVVDDEQDIRDIVQLSLEGVADWQAIPAASGAEGLRLIQTETVDAILLDVSMPDMDGFQFFQELQSNPDVNRIPVVLLTAKVLAGDLRQFAEMGVAGVITKPFNPATIADQMAEILGWRV